MLLFLRYDLFVENLIFRCFYPSQTRLKPWALGYESCCKNSVPGENLVILWLLVLTQYQRATDRQTHRLS